MSKRRRTPGALPTNVRLSRFSCRRCSGGTGGRGRALTGGTSLRSSFLGTQSTRIEPQGTKAFFEFYSGYLLSFCCIPDVQTSLLVTIIDTVYPSTRSDRNVISIDLPFCTKAHLPTSPRGKDAVSRKGKIFWTIRGPKCQTHWKILPTTS